MKYFTSNHLAPSALSLNFLLALSALITGCESTPQQLVIAPQTINSNGKHFLQKSAEVSVNDLRNKIHVIEIIKEDSAAQLINTSSHLGQTLAEHFTKALVDSGLNIAAASNNTITLIINNAEIKVKQSLLKYQASTQLTLTVKVATNEQVLTKTYNSKLNSEGALKADIAVLERDFNQQLSALLQQIVNDSEVYQFIKS